jgi:hypothetical protein
MFRPYQTWIHNNKELDSLTNHITVSDVDTVIMNYQSGAYLLLEWKCFNGKLGYPQSVILETLHNALKASGDKRYRGFTLIQLSGETPEDSNTIHITGELINGDKVYRPDRTITPDELTKLLQLDWKGSEQ